jgi:hypothetical protein
MLRIESAFLQNFCTILILLLNRLELLLTELLVAFLVLSNLSKVEEFVFEAVFHLLEFFLLEHFLLVLELFH